jgi:hypothetical protein
MTNTHDTYFTVLNAVVFKLCAAALWGAVRNLKGAAIFKGAGPARGVFNVFQNTGAEGATTVKRAPNAIGKGAEREMNTVKFWLEPALTRRNIIVFLSKCAASQKV